MWPLAVGDGRQWTQPVPVHDKMSFLASTSVQLIGSGHPSVFVATTSQAFVFPPFTTLISSAPLQNSSVLIKFFSFSEERETGDPNLHYICDSFSHAQLLSCKVRVLPGVYLIRTRLSYAKSQNLTLNFDKKIFKHQWAYQIYPNDHNWGGGLKGRGGCLMKAYCRRWEGGGDFKVCVAGSGTSRLGAGEQVSPWSTGLWLIRSGGIWGQGLVNFGPARSTYVFPELLLTLWFLSTVVHKRHHRWPWFMCQLWIFTLAKSLSKCVYE